MYVGFCHQAEFLVAAMGRWEERDQCVDQISCKPKLQHKWAGPWEPLVWVQGFWPKVKSKARSYSPTCLSSPFSVLLLLLSSYFLAFIFTPDLFFSIQLSQLFLTILSPHQVANLPLPSSSSSYPATYLPLKLNITKIISSSSTV